MSGVRDSLETDDSENLRTAQEGARMTDEGSLNYLEERGSRERQHECFERPQGLILLINSSRALGSSNGQGRSLCQMAAGF